VLLNTVSAFAQGKTRAQVHAADLNYIRGVTESCLTIATAIVDRVVDRSSAHSYEMIAGVVKSLRSQLNLRRTC
jgi:aromatic ring hydroxylase